MPSRLKIDCVPLVVATRGCDREASTVHADSMLHRCLFHPSDSQPLRHGRLADSIFVSDRDSLWAPCILDATEDPAWADSVHRYILASYFWAKKGNDLCELCTVDVSGLFWGAAQQ
jgi:hypothetical protein